jgi:ubiquinone/menaquinone biosynthesis C-methylase UbiE
LDVVDVLPIQLQNLRRKLPVSTQVRLLQRDSTALGFADASYDQAILFFLLHEQPAAVRKQTVAEAIRVVRPGGKLVVVDYHQPLKTHPLRYILPPVLRTLEPYALDLWDDDNIDKCLANVAVRRKTFYGGLYQQLVIAV